MSKLWNELTVEERTAYYANLQHRREQMKKEPLLPCPFCGNKEPHRRTEYDTIEAGVMAPGSGAGTVSREYVFCQQCGAKHNAPNPDSSHWNTRP